MRVSQPSCEVGFIRFRSTALTSMNICNAISSIQFPEDYLSLQPPDQAFSTNCVNRAIFRFMIFLREISGLKFREEYVPMNSKATTHNQWILFRLTIVKFVRFNVRRQQSTTGGRGHDDPSDRSKSRR